MEDLPLGRIAALVPEFAVKDLPLGRTLTKMTSFVGNSMITSNLIYCRASGRKGRGRSEKTSSLNVSSPTAVDIFWRLALTIFTSPESAASSEEVSLSESKPFRPDALQCCNDTGRYRI